MLIVLVFAFVVCAGGIVATYLYEDRAHILLWRVCAGTVTGLSVCALACFVAALAVGLNLLSIIFGTLVACAPLLLLTQTVWRSRVLADWRELVRSLRHHTLAPNRRTLVYGACLLAATVLVWTVCAKVMYTNAAGDILTGFDNNLGDLPFHTGMITGFASGKNIPPMHPEMAGVRLTYPFLVNFLTAIFVTLEANLEQSFFVVNLLLLASLVGLLYFWARELTGESSAGIITVAIVLLSGGFGWTMLAGDMHASSKGLFELLAALPHNYTITNAGAAVSGSGTSGYRWGNALTVLLVPQRGLLLGVPLAFVIFTLLWRVISAGNADDGEAVDGQRLNQSRVEDGHRFAWFDLSMDARRMIAAGMVAGLLPLSHAHTFGVVMIVAAWLALVFWQPRVWIWFFAVASVIALPQIAWAVAGSSTRAGDFLAWQFGWDREGENVFWFWLKNTGVFIPLLAVSLVWLWNDRRARSAAQSSNQAAVSKRARKNQQAKDQAAKNRSVVASGKHRAAKKADVVKSEQAIDDARIINAQKNDAGISEAQLSVGTIAAASPSASLNLSQRLSSRRALSWQRGLLLYYAPFALFFIAPNLFKMSPWIWDNIKVLFYWFLASAPLVAWLIVRLWRAGSVWKVPAVALLILLTLSGALDVWRAGFTNAAEQQIFTDEGQNFASILERVSAPRAVIANAPTYNHPVLLSGRQSVMGYAGHLWSQGLKYDEREAELERIYAGATDAPELLRKYNVQFIVFSPMEAAQMPLLNEEYFKRYEKVGEVGEYRIYKITQP